MQMFIIHNWHGWYF